MTASGTPAGSVDLHGRRALVTGGPRGIGKVIAEALLAAGAEVVVASRSEPQQLPQYGDQRAHFIAADIRDVEQQARLVDETVAAVGGLDLLVNNAGGSPEADARTASPRLMASVITLNLVAPMQLARLAYPALEQSHAGGLIINIGSVSGRHPMPGTAAYSAAKAGLSMATRALAVEFAPAVRVNEVTVGLVLTDAASDYYGDDDGPARVAGVIPMQRMATAQDVAGAVLLLCSPLAGYINGASLLVDGGGELPARLLAARPPTPG
ncbi:hypothetical protein ATK17_3231 [Branchiibius hedensis]|uniref:NAD(P)-dependent dehydrogenase, short-chain alcohol dehydrogenase family n=1 Tax=Branchiibius hedensis TaxID=672460 RepID=A0A2Y8ZWD4_9MICO|nr:SDR family oxidoreductase [Branchiibius hedensis]PWJ27045.1 hypothetical protein ATK17_3231 [Branchiibius hedensis]SSA35856.1 hypothetical protein SAMN04489750_3231 [Branchiibius hedensis]